MYVVVVLDACVSAICTAFSLLSQNENRYNVTMAAVMMVAEATVTTTTMHGIEHKKKTAQQIITCAFGTKASSPSSNIISDI